MYALSGNRTLGDRLEGEHVTTTPMVPNTILYKIVYYIYFIFKLK